MAREEGKLRYRKSIYDTRRRGRQMLNVYVKRLRKTSTSNAIATVCRVSFVAAVIIIVSSEIAIAQDVAGKIESLRSRIMPVGFAIGSLSAVFGLIGAMTSERIGWGWFTRSIVGVGALALVNALVMLVRSSLGGF